MRFWTIGEARAELPSLREILPRLRRKASAGRGNGHPPPSDEETKLALAELAAKSIVLRDPEVGLIDFHARGSDGVVYLLCWRLDEDDIAWWHGTDEGFASRKPLPRIP